LPLLQKSTDTQTEKNVVAWKLKLIGICLAFLQAFLLICINTLVKKMKLNFDDVLFMRSIGQILIAFLFVIKNKRSIWIWEVDEGKRINQLRTLLIFSGIVVGLLNLCDLIAISFMPLGDAMTIILSSVLPTIIIARIFLKERLKLCKLICTILIISGIVLVTRPPFLFKDIISGISNNTHFDSDTKAYSSDMDSNRPMYYYYGVMAALLCTVSIGTLRVVLKILTLNNSTSSFELPLLYGGFGCLIVSLLVPLFGGNQKIIFPSPQVEQYGIWEWLSLSIVVVLGIINFCLRFKAIKLIGPVIYGFICTSEIILAYFIQTTLFDTVPYISSLIGSGCIAIACIGILLEYTFLEILPATLRNIF
jgi:drug/metabolite transporter (DMT)-like permease